MFSFALLHRITKKTKEVQMSNRKKKKLKIFSIFYDSYKNDYFLSYGFLSLDRVENLNASSALQRPLIYCVVTIIENVIAHTR